MKACYFKIVVVAFCILTTSIPVFAGGSVVITEPVTKSTISSPVKVCMEVQGLEVEPAKNGVKEGKGHHHLIVNSNLPEDLSKPIGKDLTHIHMGDGSTCKELKMAPGRHIIRALFATGDHIPSNPVVTSAVFIKVK